MDSQFIKSYDPESEFYQRSDRPFSYRLLAKYLAYDSPDSKYKDDSTGARKALEEQAAFLPEYEGEGGFVGTFCLCTAVFALSSVGRVLTRVSAVLR